MKSWFVTFEMPCGGVYKTFEVDAVDTPAAAAAGQQMATRWVEQMGRPTTGHLPIYRRCAPIPPGWLEMMGRRSREGGHIEVMVGPGAGAADAVTGEIPVEWQERFPLADRLDLHRHSPTGFQWGYPGSGPAQLALAACSFALGDERALGVYQAIKDQLFARVQSDVWIMSVSRLRAMAEEIEGRQRKEGQG
jgi:hypothetical protein